METITLRMGINRFLESKNTLSYFLGKNQTDFKEKPGTQKINVYTFPSTISIIEDKWSYYSLNGELINDEYYNDGKLIKTEMPIIMGVN